MGIQRERIDDMDGEEIEEAKRVLANVLAAVERGELEASPVEVGALIGGLEVLKGLYQTGV